LWCRPSPPGDAGALSKELYVTLMIKVLFLLGEEYKDPEECVKMAHDDYHAHFGEGTKQVMFRQFYKAVFCDVHALYPGHKVGGCTRVECS
jgi:hypothetical protein